MASRYGPWERNETMATAQWPSYVPVALEWLAWNNGLALCLHDAFCRAGRRQRRKHLANVHYPAVAAYFSTALRQSRQRPPSPLQHRRPGAKGANAQWGPTRAASSPPCKPPTARAGVLPPHSTQRATLARGVRMGKRRHAIDHASSRLSRPCGACCAVGTLV